MSHEFEGLCAVLATPFDSSGQLDRESLEREVHFYLDRGATSLVALGVMGEGPALSREESLQVVQGVAKVAGPETPLIVSAVGMEHDMVVEFGKRVVQAGASSLMLTAPQTVEASSLTDHFGDVNAATGASLVLLDSPAIAPSLSADRLVDLSRELDSFCAIKLEDNPTFLKIHELKRRLGDRLAVLGANGAVMCLSELNRGCDGFMTGYAYPEHLIEIMAAHRSGDHDRAAVAYARYLPLITYCWQPVIGMALRKELLVERGVIASSYVRSPHAAIDAETRKELLGVTARVADCVGATK